jgi:hypothetical protein
MIVMSGPLSTARVARHFNIPAERLFEAWLDTSVIGQWMFGPNVRDEQIVNLSNDPRVGASSPLWFGAKRMNSITLEHTKKLHGHTGWCFLGVLRLLENQTAIRWSRSTLSRMRRVRSLS